MLMLGRSKLAQTCYEAWAKREDVSNPVIDRTPTQNPDYKLVPLNRMRPRPRWETLTPVEQETWRCVADAAGELLTEAMGAVST